MTSNIPLKRNKNNNLYILSLQGGGVKGCIQVAYLKLLQEYLKKYKTTIYDFFDLIVGTSVGSIIGGCLAYGVSPNTLQSIFKSMIPKIFKKRLWVPRYDRQVLINEFRSNIGEPLLLNLLTNYIATSVDICSDKTHFFKSWEDKDSRELLLNVILKSSAAPYYFGRYEDEYCPECVWLDGGVGTNNNPVMIALVETFRQNLLENYNVNIVSVGTGCTDETTTYKIASNWNNLKEVLYYLDFKDGGRARSQISRESEIYIQSMNLPALKLHSINSVIDKKYDLMDGVKYIDYYNDLGLEFYNSPENKILLQNIDNCYNNK